MVTGCAGPDRVRRGLPTDSQSLTVLSALPVASLAPDLAQAIAQISPLWARSFE